MIAAKAARRHAKMPIKERYIPDAQARPASISLYFCLK